MATNVAPRYVIISPVKDEERYVELTLRSITLQTIKPTKWIIVDDGSRDNTVNIVDAYAKEYPFIQLVRTPAGQARRPGVGVIEAFNRGRAAAGESNYEFIVKLDCDLSFDANYFERLFERFSADPAIGIASGIYSETDRRGEWVQVQMPAYHAFGACKAVRRECFESIGGFVAAKGWDTVDEIRAMSRGWKTSHFTDLVTKHHKPEGSGIGVLKTSRMHGEIYYVTGGDPLFLVFKSLYRATGKPLVLGGLALMAGYLKAVLNRTPRLVTDSEAKCYRDLLRRRLWRARRPLHPTGVGPTR